MKRSKGTVGPHTELLELLETTDESALWAGRDRQLESKVLVEIAMAPLRTVRSARFERRAQTAERFAHPAVFSVLGHGLDAGIPYVIGEPLHGESLLARLRAGAPLGLRHAARIVEQVLEALAALHTEGLGRVGITPDRVQLVGMFQPNARLRLDVIEGEPSAIIRELGCVAPERMEEDTEPDARTALWETAALAYFAMIGKSPFVGPTGPEWAQAIRKGDFPRLALRGDGGEASRIELDAWFRVALAGRPEDRFESATEMLDSWRSVVGGIMLFVDDNSDGPVTLVPLAAEDNAEVDTLVPPPHEEEATEIFPRLSPVDFKHNDNSAIARLAKLLDDDEEQEKTIASVRAASDSLPPPLPVPSEPVEMSEPPPVSEPPPSYEGPYDVRQRVVLPALPQPALQHPALQQSSDHPFARTVAPEHTPRSFSPQMLGVAVIVAALSSALTSWLSATPPATAPDCNCPEVAAAATREKECPAAAPARTAEQAPSLPAVAPVIAEPVTEPPSPPPPAWPPIKPAFKPAPTSPTPTPNASPPIVSPPIVSPPIVSPPSPSPPKQAPKAADPYGNLGD